MNRLIQLRHTAQSNTHKQNVQEHAACRQKKQQQQNNNNNQKHTAIKKTLVNL
jgi:hypothetical protein